MALFGSKGRNLIGLDIGSSSVKLCELETIGKGSTQKLRLVRLGWVPIPPDTIVDGEIMDGNAVTGAIRTLIAEHKVKTKDVAISVSGQQVMVKKVTLPVMTPQELAESIRWEAESFFPAGQGLDAYALDYSITNERTPDGNMDVVLVACRKDKLESYVSSVIQAGLRPVVVDVDVFTIQNAFEATAQSYNPNEVVVLINVGAAFTNLTMMIGRLPVFWRDVNWGSNRFTDKLMEDWGLSREGAEAVKRGENAEDRSPEEVLPSILAVADGFTDEVSRTLDFFRQSFKVDRLDRVILTGGGAKTTAIMDSLGNRIRVPVERGNPFQGIEIDERTVDPAVVRDMGCSAAVVLGLALRSEGDR